MTRVILKRDLRWLVVGTKMRGGITRSVRGIPSEGL